MVAAAGGRDALLAYPVVGPNIARLARLVRSYRGTTFRAIVDDPDAARALSSGMEGLDRAAPGPGRPRGRHGPDRHRSRRSGLRAVRAGGSPAEPRPRRLAGLRRPHPRQRPRRASARPRGRASSGRCGSAIGCWRAGSPCLGWSWGGRPPSRSTPRSTCRGSSARRGPARCTTPATRRSFPTSRSSPPPSCSAG